MHISYFDDARVSKTQLQRKERQLRSYRESVTKAESDFDLNLPEASLYYPKGPELSEELRTAQALGKRLKYVLLIGIGGQSLGVEAVHSVLDKGQAELLVLDTISVSRLASIKADLSKCKNVSQIAVCVSSKSGTTTEVLTNAAIILDELSSRFGPAIYEQTFFIGTAGTDFLKYGKTIGAKCVTMPESIGGRYSVATAAGLLPLALLGHDIEEFITGYLDATSPTLESVIAESAARLATYHQIKYPHYNFFAFESRLEALGRWYRQLFAESLGKAVDNTGKRLTHAMVPTISTPIDLHSVGQLYMSGVPTIYTDFVSFDDDTLDVMIPKQTKLAKHLRGYSMQEIATALYGGVIAAYQDRHLPYRATLFEENLPYSIGQFMAMRIREIMYTANLLGVNAFDQPNVELYKQKTKEILFS